MSYSHHCAIMVLEIQALLTRRYYNGFKVSLWFMTWQFPSHFVVSCLIVCVPLGRMLTSVVFFESVHNKEDTVLLMLSERGSPYIGSINVVSEDAAPTRVNSCKVFCLFFLFFFIHKCPLLFNYIVRWALWSHGTGYWPRRMHNRNEVL